jgi:hypothetical protein
MKLKIAAIALFGAAVSTTTPAFADHKARETAREVVALADGGTLYIFKDGKMAKANQFGRATYLKKGEVLRTAQGKSIEVTSNEVARLGTYLAEDYPGD